MFIVIFLLCVELIGLFAVPKFVVNRGKCPALKGIVDNIQQNPILSKLGELFGNFLN